MPILDEIMQFTQLVSSGGTLAALGCSVYIANKARREVSEDRLFRTRPIVVGRKGVHAVPVERRAFEYNVPGKDTAEVQQVFSQLPTDALAIFARPYGQLVNVGQGPALDVSLTYVPRQIRIGDDEVRIDAERKNPKYSREWNTCAAIDDILAAGAEGKISSLPVFVQLDFADQITYAEGILEIAYRDISSTRLRTHQQFSYMNNGPAAEHRYQITLSDTVKIP